MSTDQTDTETNTSSEPRAGGPAMTKVTITMPVTLHEELKERAHARNISVTELMRRAVALDALVNEEKAKVYLRDPDTGQEQLLRVL